MKIASGVRVRRNECDNLLGVYYLRLEGALPPSSAAGPQRRNDHSGRRSVLRDSLSAAPSSSAWPFYDSRDGHVARGVRRGYYDETTISVLGDSQRGRSPGVSDSQTRYSILNLRLRISFVRCASKSHCIVKRDSMKFTLVAI